MWVFFVVQTTFDATNPPPPASKSWLLASLFPRLFHAVHSATPPRKHSP